VLVGPGSVIHVGSSEPHQFTDITADLSVIGVFTPPEGSRT
jgi:hypothetical protein